MAAQLVTQVHRLYEVAKQIGVHPRTVRRYADDGEFPNAYRLPGGAWRIPQSDIDAFKAKCRHTTQATNVVTT